MARHWGKVALASLALTATIWGGAQAATVTVVDSRAALESAFAGMGATIATEDFEDGSVGPGLSILTFGGPHVVGMQGQNYRFAGIYGQSFLQVNGATGATSQYLDSVSSASSLATVWFFSHEQRGLGADWDLGLHGEGESLRLSAVFEGGEQFVGEINPTMLGAQSGYFGFTSDQSFTAVILRGAQGLGANAETFAVDNLSFGRVVTAVPEPESALLLLLGLAGLGAFGRRRASSTAVSGVTQRR